MAENAEFQAFLRANPERRVVMTEVRDELRTYWRAWQHLKDDRPVGAFGGAGGIYYSSISCYARDHGIAGEEFEMFLRFIRAMDREYLDHLAEKLEQSRQQE